MAKLTEYPAATSFDSGDILIKDGTNGTKKISVDDASVNFIEIANQTVSSSQIAELDDCVLITNDADGVRKMLVADISGNAHVRELSYSQYQALSNAEKTNGTTYYVTDDPNDVVSGVIDYSTTEQNTGLKWVDRKPIYRKTLVNIPNNTNVSLSSLNIDTLIKYEGNWINTIDSTPYVRGLDSYHNEYGWSNITYDASNNTLRLNMRGSGNHDGNIITIYYTKTTDTV